MLIMYFSMTLYIPVVIKGIAVVLLMVDGFPFASRNFARQWLNAQSSRDWSKHPKNSYNLSISNSSKKNAIWLYKASKLNVYVNFYLKNIVKTCKGTLLNRKTTFDLGFKIHWYYIVRGSPVITTPYRSDTPREKQSVICEDMFSFKNLVP